MIRDCVKVALIFGNGGDGVVGYELGDLELGDLERGGSERKRFEEINMNHIHIGVRVLKEHFIRGFYYEEGLGKVFEKVGGGMRKE